jgi:hypothetical protein
MGQWFEFDCTAWRERSMRCTVPQISEDAVKAEGNFGSHRGWAGKYPCIKTYVSIARDEATSHSDIG